MSVTAILFAASQLGIAALRPDATCAGSTEVVEFDSGALPVLLATLAAALATVAGMLTLCEDLGGRKQPMAAIASSHYGTASSLGTSLTMAAESASANPAVGPAGVAVVIGERQQLQADP
jgi:hypothetical protein